MPLGSLIRGLFGPYERELSERYRSLYVDNAQLAEVARRWSPGAAEILEVGCGEGAMVERLAAAYPSSAITAIDITPRLGRLYTGPADRVKFVQTTIQELVASGPRRYDLIVLADVLHHVPAGFRRGLLEAIRAALSPGGSFVFKDWEPNRSLIHWMGYAADRWLTGDRISFLTRTQMRQLLADSFGEAALVDEARIAPRWNNLAVLVRPG